MDLNFSHSQDDPAYLVGRVEQDSQATAVLELSAGTTYYGIGDIFRRYAGLPHDEPLPFSADHYVPWLEEEPHLSDLAAGLPTFLATTKRRARSYAKQGIPHSIAVGAPIHYLTSTLEAQGRSALIAENGRRGTIAFPHKSTLGIDRTFDYAAFADELVNLPEEYHPVVVCVYWQDYQAGRHRAYLDEGLQVITCGNVYEPLFLHRFVDAVSRFRYACGNAIGSSYPLAVSCGCQFFLLDSGPICENRIGDSDGRVLKQKDESSCNTLLKLRRLAPFPPTSDSFGLQKKYVEELTGKKFLKSPEEIYRIYNRGRKAILKNQEKGEKFTEPVPPAALNRWLPRGIYTDGWARNSCQLTVCRRGTLILCLEIPHEISPDDRTLSVSVGEAEPLEFSIKPGYYNLSLPGIPPEGATIRFHTKIEEKMLPEDSRSVAFRLLVWKCETHSPQQEPKCQSIGWRKVEQLMASLEEKS